MRPPERRGTDISDLRIEKWLENFSGFRDTPTRPAIDRWLNRFAVDHKDIAARLLDCVEIISNQDMRAAFRRILAELPEWHDQEDRRSGQWVFVARETSAGESGGTMLHLFRNATGMSSTKCHSLFRYVRDLPGMGLGPSDNVVFVDDFAGTGDQVCNDWQVMKELLTGKPNLYLLLIAIPIDTIKKIEDETAYRIYYDIALEGRDNVFSSKCRYFNKDEREIIEKYCQKANLVYPKGYGNRGLLLVFHHGCPNNSIPILHEKKQAWVGLFPRYDFEARKHV